MPNIAVVALSRSKAVNMRINQVLDDKGRSVTTGLPDDRVSDVAKRLSALKIGVVVVTGRRGELTGVFSERDLVNLLAAEGAPALQRRLGDVMTRDVITCHGEDRIDTALTLMVRHRIRHMPVVDDGKLCGLVSIRDLVRLRFAEKELEADVLLDLARMRG